MPLIRTGQRERVPQDDVRILPWVMAQVWGSSRGEQLREAHRRWESWQPRRSPYVSELPTAPRGSLALGSAVSHGWVRAPALSPH